MPSHYYLLTSTGLKKILLVEELISKRTTVLIHFIVCARNFGDMKAKKADGAKLHRPQDALS